MAHLEKEMKELKEQLKKNLEIYDALVKTGGNTKAIKEESSWIIKSLTRKAQALTAFKAYYI